MKGLIYCFVLLSLLIVSSCSKEGDEGTKYQSLKVIKQTKELNVIGHWAGEGDREVFIRNFTRTYGLDNQEVAIILKFPK